MSNHVNRGWCIYETQVHDQDLTHSFNFAALPFELFDANMQSLQQQADLGQNDIIGVAAGWHHTAAWECERGMFETCTAHDRKHIGNRGKVDRRLRRHEMTWNDRWQNKFKQRVSFHRFNGPTLISTRFQEMTPSKSALSAPGRRSLGLGRQPLLSSWRWHQGATTSGMWHQVMLEYTYVILPMYTSIYDIYLW